MLVGTVALRSQAAHARVLAQSLERHAPGARLHVLVADLLPGEALGVGSATLVRPEALLDPTEWAVRRGIYEARALTGSLIGELLLHLLEAGDAAAYLDVGSVPGPGVAALLEHVAHQPVSLVRRALVPGPAEPAVLADGPYGSGVVAATRAGEPFLRWWAWRLARGCDRIPGAGHDHERSWLTAGASYFPVSVLPDALTPLGYEGLAGRELRWADGQGLLVDGRPLPAVLLGGGFRSMHPAGSDEPLALGLLPSRSPAFARLVEEHGAALRAAGELAAAREHYRWASAPDGLRLDPTMRRLHRQAVLHAEATGQPLPPSPFAADSTAFVAWLAEPLDLRVDTAPLSRYLLALREDTPELQRRFSHADGERLWRWAREVLELPEPLLGPGPEEHEAVTSPEELSAGVTLIGPPPQDDPATDALLGALAQAEVDHGRIVWSGAPQDRLTGSVSLLAPARYDTSVLVFEAEALIDWEVDLGRFIRHHRHNIAVWRRAPGPATGQALLLVDEIWVDAPALAAELANWTPKPVRLVPLGGLASAAPARAVPQGPLRIGVVADLTRVVASQLPAALSALALASGQQAVPEVVLLGADADRRAAETLHLQTRQLAGRCSEVADAAAAADALAGCDLVCALHPAPETPPAVRELVARGVPVVGLEGAAAAGVLVAELPRDRVMVHARSALAGLLADRVALHRRGALAAEQLAQTTGPAALTAWLGAHVAGPPVEA